MCTEDMQNESLHICRIRKTTLESEYLGEFKTTIENILYGWLIMSSDEFNWQNQLKHKSSCECITFKPIV
jgi:hypothetical protein